MSDPLWRRVSELVARALELPEADRAGFIARESDDERVRREVASLVEAATSGEDTLERLATQVRSAASRLVAEEPSRTGGRIGPWRLLERLGQGGMGTVYRAERADGAFRQQVALKLMRSPLLGREGRERFTAEREILARLEHPAIARILDGGILEDGAPWFAMELVEGVPITEACAGGDLGLSARLDLFRKVCDAVDYAHRNLVVHRDLKPGNVLVTPEGEVKLIDFGVAKLLEAEGRGREEPHPLTPAYAAPEQLRGEPTTTATDVWALGALLYELLTGSRAREKPRPASEATARIVPPSARVEIEGSPASERQVAGSRGAAKRLRRRLAGDLDAIVLKALEPDPERRYRSTAELAADLRRHREGQPVSARRPGPGYRAACFLRRHRLGVAAALVIGVLSLALGTSVIQSGMRSRAAAERLAAERNKAEATSEFLLSVFELADRDEARGDTISARELLNRAVRRAHDELEGAPGVQASMLYTLGRAYASLGLYGSADALLSQALALRRDEAVEQDAPELADTLRELGRVRLARGEPANAEELLAEAIARYEELPTAAPSERADTLVHLAEALSARDDAAGAQATLRQALLLRRDMGDEAAAADTLYALGELAHRRDRLEEGWRHIEEAVEVYRRIGWTDTPEYASALLGLASARRDPQAVDLAEEALALRRRIYGPDHGLVGEALETAGEADRETGQLAVAERRFRQEFEIAEESAYGSDRHASALTGLARVLVRQGRLDEGLDLLERAVAIGARLPGSVTHITALDSIGDALLLRGRPQEAEKRYRERLTICRAIVGPDHPLAVRGEVDLARVALTRGEYEEAASTLRRALGVYRDILPPDHPHLAEFEIDLARALAGLGRHIEARSLLQRAAAVLEDTYGAEDRRVQRASRLLASL